MKDTVYVLKLGSYLFAGEKSVRDCVMPFLTNILFDAKFSHAIDDVKEWQNEYGGKILQIDLKSHQIE